MTPPESLTESERERIGRVTTCELENSADEAEARANAVAKLLRIHDRLQGEVREMHAIIARFERVAGDMSVEHSITRRIGEFAAEIARGLGATGEDVDKAIARQEEAFAASTETEPFTGRCPTCGQRYHPPPI